MVLAALRGKLPGAEGTLCGLGFRVFCIAPTPKQLENVLNIVPYVFCMGIYIESSI